MPQSSVPHSLRAPAGTTSSPRSRAAVVTAPGEVRLVDRDPPEPSPGQVRIRLEGCGVCASSVPLWEGRPWFDYPREPGSPGHEGWGTVDAMGDGVTGIDVGDRVAALSYCAFAEHDLADASAVVRLPDELAGVPVPGEPLGCAMNVFERSGIEPGQTVVVIGIGFLGGLLTRLAANAGARVIAVSRRPFSLELAERLGAETVLPLDGCDVLAAVRGLTGERGCERVIECTGHQQPLDLAGELVAVRGRLVIAGYHQDGLRQVNLQSWNWRGIDVINAHEREQDVYVQGIRRAVAEILAGRLDPTPLYTHTFPLDELGAALECTRTRPDGFLKALVTTGA